MPGGAPKAGDEELQARVGNGAVRGYMAAQALEQFSSGAQRMIRVFSKGFVFTDELIGLCPLSAKVSGLIRGYS